MRVRTPSSNSGERWQRAFTSSNSKWHPLRRKERPFPEPVPNSSRPDCSDRAGGPRHQKDTGVKCARPLYVFTHVLRNTIYCQSLSLLSLSKTPKIYSITYYHLLFQEHTLTFTYYTIALHVHTCTCMLSFTSHSPLTLLSHSLTFMYDCMYMHAPSLTFPPLLSLITHLRFELW